MRSPRWKTTCAAVAAGFLFSGAGKVAAGSPAAPGSPLVAHDDASTESIERSITACDHRKTVIVEGARRDEPLPRSVRERSRRFSRT